MSLSWDITKCDRIPRDPLPADYEGEEQIGPVTDEFWPVVNHTIWRMLAVGMGWKLTDENKREFYLRSRAYALLTGDRDITPEEVHQMVGLHVNVSPVTKAAWRKRMLDERDRENGRAFDRAMTKLEKADEEETNDVNHG